MARRTSKIYGETEQSWQVGGRVARQQRPCEHGRKDGGGAGRSSPCFPPPDIERGGFLNTFKIGEKHFFF